MSKITLLKLRILYELTGLMWNRGKDEWKTNLMSLSFALLRLVSYEEIEMFFDNLGSYSGGWDPTFAFIAEEIFKKNQEKTAASITNEEDEFLLDSVPTSFLNEEGNLVCQAAELMDFLSKVRKKVKQKSTKQVSKHKKNIVIDNSELFLVQMKKIKPLEDWFDLDFAFQPDLFINHMKLLNCSAGCFLEYGPHFELKQSIKFYAEEFSSEFFSYSSFDNCVKLLLESGWNGVSGSPLPATDVNIFSVNYNQHFKLGGLSIALESSTPINWGYRLTSFSTLDMNRQIEQFYKFGQYHLMNRKDGKITKKNIEYSLLFKDVYELREDLRYKKNSEFQQCVTIIDKLKIEPCLENKLPNTSEMFEVFGFPNYLIAGALTLKTLFVDLKFKKYWTDELLWLIDPCWLEEGVFHEDNCKKQISDLAALFEATIKNYKTEDVIILNAANIVVNLSKNKIMSEDLPREVFLRRIVKILQPLEELRVMLPKPVPMEFRIHFNFVLIANKKVIEYDQTLYFYSPDKSRDSNFHLAIRIFTPMLNWYNADGVFNFNNCKKQLEDFQVYALCMHRQFVKDQYTGEVADIAQMFTAMHPSAKSDSRSLINHIKKCSSRYLNSASGLRRMMQYLDITIPTRWVKSALSAYLGKIKNERVCLDSTVTRMNESKIKESKVNTVSSNLIIVHNPFNTLRNREIRVPTTISSLELEEQLIKLAFETPTQFNRRNRSESK